MTRDPKEPLMLHHGTTRRAADAIVRSGWKAQDTATTVARIAEEHHVLKSKIFDDLERFARFALTDDRDSRVSFSPRFGKAAHSWAQRAPEAEWEALWSVYRIKFMNKECGEAWTGDTSGHAWVWDQMRNEALAVVSFSTTYAELVSLGASLHASQPRPLPEQEVLLGLWDDLPELVIPLPLDPGLGRLSVTDIYRHLPWSVYAHRLGLTEDEFIRRADAGEFGSPASDRVPAQDSNEQRPWWTAADATRRL